MNLLKAQWLALLSVTFLCLSTFRVYPAQQDKISFKGKFLIGAAAGGATTAFIEPLIYIKNRLQQNKPLYFRQIYRGLPINAAGFIPTMAIQNSVFSEVENALSQTTLSEPCKKIIAAFAAGTASAITSAPRELLIIQQQNNGGNFYEIYKKLIQQHGIMVTWKAGALVAARNSSFAGCLFILAPALSPYLAILAPVAAGSISAIATHPLDTVKTRLQAAPQKTVKQVAQEVYHEVHSNAYSKQGAASFFRGILPRIAGVAATMTLEYRFRNYFTQLYQDKSSKKSCAV